MSIIKIFEKQKRGKLKVSAICVVVYVLMIAIVSIFFGSPFTHREFIFVRRGWISERWFVLCAAVGLAAGVGSMLFKIMKDFKAVDSRLFNECDARGYLDEVMAAESYGRNLNFKGFQKTIFFLTEQRYVLALIANAMLEEGEKYLSEKWIGNKNSALYRRTALNVRLAQLYESKDAAGFWEVLAQAGRTKSRVFYAQGLILEEKYNEAIAILTEKEEKLPYNETIRNYLLGVCYDRLGDLKSAEIYMEYATQHGNTMPCAYSARLWTENHMKGL